MASKEEKNYLSRVAALGCIICGAEAEIHHLRAGMGMGQRNNYLNAIGLCHRHHRTGGYGIAYHAGAKKFAENFGTEQELLAEVKRRLGD